VVRALIDLEISGRRFLSVVVLMPRAWVSSRFGLGITIRKTADLIIGTYYIERRHTPCSTTIAISMRWSGTSVCVWLEATSEKRGRRSSTSSGQDEVG
jgi:hypothetical protein